MRTLLLLLSVILLGVNMTFAGSDYPKAVLTLSDGTVINGYLRENIHHVYHKVPISETVDGKKINYKTKDIQSLVVTMPDGTAETYILIYTWDQYKKKAEKEPMLAVVDFKGNHVIGYAYPSLYEQTSAAVPSSYFQSYTRTRDAWLYYYVVDTDKERVRCFWSYIPSKKTSKKFIKNLKKDFKEYPFVAETVEAEGITAEQINQNPMLLLEILDKNL